MEKLWISDGGGIMELRQLKIYEAVYRLNGFSAAARALDYSQSAVSEAVKGLETDLGIQAFERLGKRIYPTDAGHRLYSESLAVLERAQQLVSCFTGHTQTPLRIGMTESLTLYRFPEILQAFIAQQDSLSLQIELLRIEEIKAQLRDNTIDIGVVLDGEVPPQDLAAHPLFNEELVLIGGKDLSFDAQTPQTAIISKGMTGYNQLFHQICTEQGLLLSKTVYIESIEGIKSFVKAGLGIGFLPRATVQQDLAEGALKQLQLSDTLYFHQAKLLYHKDKQISQGMSAMIVHIQGKFPRFSSDGI